MLNDQIAALDKAIADARKAAEAAGDTGGALAHSNRADELEKVKQELLNRSD